jgi:hypothetical protein
MQLQSEASESLVLIVGMFAISIPVSLVAIACADGSWAVLVLAVVAMLAVGGGALTFVMLLAGDAFESAEAEPAE